MASALLRVLTPVNRLTSRMSLQRSRPSHHVVRTKVTTPTGAMLPRPHVMRFGIPAVFIFISPFIYLGFSVNEELFNFLIENDMWPKDADDAQKRFTKWRSQ
ncbi:essential MCU regulator, mitochondrial-like [Amphiura filiformis]|uniref:essential MCU regulator, mitochondrial-like n=1 Tax=Amphiura filiformis TaxID=82378 RepID=UPI003B20FC85